jgi:hypothetical protein
MTEHLFFPTGWMGKLRLVSYVQISRFINRIKKMEGVGKKLIDIRNDFILHVFVDPNVNCWFL